MINMALKWHHINVCKKVSSFTKVNMVFGSFDYDHNLRLKVMAWGGLEQLFFQWGWPHFQQFFSPCSTKYDKDAWPWFFVTCLYLANHMIVECWWVIGLSLLNLRVTTCSFIMINSMCSSNWNTFTNVGCVG